MSQQKMLLTVCLVAGFIGAAHCQGVSVNIMKCGQRYQELLNKYVTDVNGLFSRYSSQLAQTGTSAMNLEGFNAEVSKLTATLSKYTDTTQTFSIGGVTSITQEVAEQYIKVGTFFLNPQIGAAGVRMYMNLLTDSAALNSRLVADATTACLS